MKAVQCLSQLEYRGEPLRDSSHILDGGIPACTLLSANGSFVGGLNPRNTLQAIATNHKIRNIFISLSYYFTNFH